MLDQSYSLNYCFLGIVVFSDLYLFQEIVPSNSCHIFPKHLLLLFIEKVASGTVWLALFILNVACTGLAPPTSDVLDISEITEFFDYEKSSCILQLIKVRSRDLQKLHKYFME